MTELHGFTLLREERIAELNTLARIYRHVKTGAELLSLINEDENKVFGVTFRTPPPDSSGVAHIMEHSVLCGSRKYPVKEPFVELIKGSLNTFLNAFTYPDKTCYPVASQNLQDFYNLIDVYLDAVFYPLLSPYTLDQEGWHYELEDPQGTVSYKGVVFNEMKGAYSQPDGVLSDQIQRSLFPDTLYAFDSGGDPAVIPTLTYETFKAFHELYYHPSNARIFFYGDDNPDKRLELMDAALSAFQAVSVPSQIPLQPVFDAPRHVEAAYEVEEGQQNAQEFVTVNWLLPENKDPELALGLTVLEQALIGTPGSELRRALIDSGLGTDLAGSGLSTDLRQMFFSTGLRGVQAGKAQDVEALITQTLQKLAMEGLDRANLLAALNTVEFHLRENNTGGFPRGLALMIRALETWLYDGDPLAPLAFEAPLQSIRARLESGEPYFEHLIEAYLVNNTHRTTVLLKPDAALAERRAAAEAEALAKAQAALSEGQRLAIIENARTLHRRQETPDTTEALATIPMLGRDDLDPQIRALPSQWMEQEGGAGILFHDLFTNGILYLDLAFDMHTLSADLLPYMPLFGRALIETGAGEQNFVQLLQRIGQNTGGIRPNTLVSAARLKAKSVAYFILRAKAMTPQTGDLLTILRDVLTSAHLDDRERIKQMALEEKASMEAHLSSAGHVFVNTRLRAHFDESAWASEQMGGVSYYAFLRDLTARIDSDWQSIQAAFERIRSTLFTRANAIANVTLDAANFAALQPQISQFLAELPQGTPARAEWQITPLPASEGLAVPSQVNYVGKGANLFHLGYELNGSAFVIINYLYGAWLWDKIRVQGGAYGAFCSFDSQSGVLTFLSYRDPNITATLNAFDETAAYLQSIDLSDGEMVKSIIGTIGDLDAYQLPDAKGYTALRFTLLGTTDAERQRLRDEVLSVHLEDFHAFGAALERMQSQSAIAALGSAEALESAQIFETVQKVL